MSPFAEASQKPAVWDGAQLERSSCTAPAPSTCRADTGTPGRGSEGTHANSTAPSLTSPALFMNQFCFLLPFVCSPPSHRVTLSPPSSFSRHSTALSHNRLCFRDLEAMSSCALSMMAPMAHSFSDFLLGLPMGGMDLLSVLWMLSPFFCPLPRHGSTYLSPCSSLLKAGSDARSVTMHGKSVVPFSFHLEPAEGPCGGGSRAPGDCAPRPPGLFSYPLRQS